MILFSRSVCYARTEQTVPHRALGMVLPESSQENVSADYFFALRVSLMVNLTLGQQLDKISLGVDRN